MKEVIWDGIVYPEALSEDANGLRQVLADAAKKYNWDAELSVLNREPALVNTTRPGGASLYAPLHQAAYGGAPEKFIHALIRLGAWRTLQNARGERPIDIAEKRGHSHLLDPLAPKLKRRIPVGILMKIQWHFHAVVRGRPQRRLISVVCGCRSWSRYWKSTRTRCGFRCRACTAVSHIGWEKKGSKRSW
jgi:hypothetical protein